MQRAWMINLATQATIAQQNHQSQHASQSLDLLSDTLKTRTVSSDEQRRILLLIHQCREALVHDTKALRQDYQRLFQHLSAAASVEKNRLIKLTTPPTGSLPCFTQYKVSSKDYSGSCCL